LDIGKTEKGLAFPNVSEGQGRGHRRREGRHFGTRCSDDCSKGRAALSRSTSDNSLLLAIDPASNHQKEGLELHERQENLSDPSSQAKMHLGWIFWPYRREESLHNGDK
jgi:hypothetical protein